MNDSRSFKYAVAAVFTAALVPIGVPALSSLGAPDLVQGVVIGVGIGATVLLLALALKHRPA